VDLFNEPEFEKYRVLEMEAGADFIKSFMNGKHSGDYIDGAMDMLRRIVSVPTKMITEDNESQQDQAEMLKEKAIAVVQGNLLKRFMEGD
jgi:hypothetical protein